VVDDEPDVRELFNITLKMAGHITETANDGIEAVDRLKNDNIPDLIVLDLMMPNLDGFGLLAHIRKEMDGKPVRVLVATAKVLEDADRERLSSWPVVGVLNKGELDIGQMVVIVSSALSKNPIKNGSKVPEQAAKPAAEVPPKREPASIPSSFLRPAPRPRPAVPPVPIPPRPGEKPAPKMPSPGDQPAPSTPRRDPDAGKKT
jgi:CheY-like chemotaxis protein